MNLLPATIVRQPGGGVFREGPDNVPKWFHSRQYRQTDHGKISFGLPGQGPGKRL